MIKNLWRAVRTFSEDFQRISKSSEQRTFRKPFPGRNLTKDTHPTKLTPYATIVRICGGHPPIVFDRREFHFGFDFDFDFEMFHTLQISRFVGYRSKFVGYVPYNLKRSAFRSNGRKRNETKQDKMA